MAQQVIDGTLYSPVNSNSIGHGDMVRTTFDAVRIVGTPKVITDDGDPYLRAEARLLTGQCAGKMTWLKWWPNEPVLRAVGATGGGLL